MARLFITRSIISQVAWLYYMYSDFFAIVRYEMKKGKVVAEISVVPVGTGSAGLSQYVAACLDVLQGREDISYQLTPMGTVLEGSLDIILEVVRQMHETPFDKGVYRVVTTLKIDERRDKLGTMVGKVESVLKLRPSVRM